MTRLQLALVGATLAARLASAQQMTMRMSSGEIVATGPGQMLVVTARDSMLVVDGVVGDVVLDVRKGDRVVSVQGRMVNDLRTFMQAYRDARVGEPITLGVMRQAVRHMVRFDKPAPTAGATMAVTSGTGGSGAWTTNAAGGESVNILGAELTENSEGLPEVTNRRSHPLASTLPLRVGDVLTAFNGRPLAALAGLKMWMDQAKTGDKVTLTVRRGSEELTFTFAKAAE